MLSVKVIDILMKRKLLIEKLFEIEEYEVFQIIKNNIKISDVIFVIIALILVIAIGLILFGIILFTFIVLFEIFLSSLLTLLALLVLFFYMD